MNSKINTAALILSFALVACGSEYKIEVPQQPTPKVEVTVQAPDNGLPCGGRCYGSGVQCDESRGVCVNTTQPPSESDSQWDFYTEPVNIGAEETVPPGVWVRISTFKLHAYREISVSSFEMETDKIYDKFRLEIDGLETDTYETAAQDARDWLVNLRDSRHVNAGDDIYVSLYAVVSTDWNTPGEYTSRMVGVTAFLDNGQQASIEAFRGVIVGKYILEIGQDNCIENQESGVFTTGASNQSIQAGWEWRFEYLLFACKPIELRNLVIEFGGLASLSDVEALTVTINGQMLAAISGVSSNTQINLSPFFEVEPGVTRPTVITFIAYFNPTTGVGQEYNATLRYIEAVDHESRLQVAPFISSPATYWAATVSGS